MEKRTLSKKKPLSIVLVLIAMVLMYFGFNINDLGINETIQSNTNNESNENNTSNEAIQYNFRSDKLLDVHYKKHKDEFGDITKEEYLKKANDVINNESETVMTKLDEDGDIIYYDSQTNEFLVFSVDGYIRTYFIPEDGIEYFNRK